MNVGLTRFIKSAYRREPIPSTLITMGLVEAVIGGFDYKWSLFTFGLLSAGVALGWRWWMIQQRQPLAEEQPVVQQYLLPHSSSSNTALPMLSMTKKKPPY